MLAGLIVFAFVLGQVQTAARNDGRADVVTRAIQGTVYPLASVMHSTLVATEDFLKGVRDARALREENERLRAEAEALKNYQATVDNLRRRLEDLSEMAGYQQPPQRTKVFCRVIGFMPDQNRATLDRGSRDGIEPYLAVVSAKGLVGIVETVSETHCQVLLVTSPAVRIASQVNGERTVRGIVRGETADRLVMDMLESEPVYTGELVTTSGFSQTVPEGIPVGTVVEAIDDPQFGMKRVFVLPHVHMGSVDEVFVLR